MVNKTRFVSEELIKKVEKAIEDLNYTPNQLATGLRQKKTGTIGVIVSDISIPFYSSFVKEVEEVLSPLNYSIIMGSSFYNPEKESKILASMRAKRVDGIMLFPETDTSKEIDRIVKSGIPVVTIERKIPGSSIDGVYVDNEKAAYKATEYLIDNGHRVIAFIDRLIDKSHSVDRRNGFMKAMKDNNIKIEKDYFIRGGFTYEDGYRNAKTILNKLPKVTAILTFGDMSAVGAIKAINEMSLEVPKDISVIGHIDMSISRYVSPTLTTIKYPVQNMAKNAAKILFIRINKKSDIKLIKNIILTLDLIIRESTGKVNPKRI